jgi:tetratricopeptide (TPR) repeat protein
MNRNINLPVLIVLLVSGIALAVGFRYSHDYQIERLGRESLECANQAALKANLEETARCLRIYTGLHPRNGDVLAWYALLLSQRVVSSETSQQALVALEKAIDVDGQRNDVRREFARLALAAGRFAEAKQHASFLLTITPKDAELERWLGQCEQALENHPEAAEFFAQSIEHQPQQVEVYGWRADLLRQRLGQPEKADQVVKAMLAANPKSAPARLVAARYYSSAGLLDEAEREIQFALNDRSAEDVDLIKLGADVALARGDFDQAQKRLARCRQLLPDDPRLNLDLARLDIQCGRLEEARILLQSVSLPTEADDLAVLAPLLLGVGMRDRAGVAIERLRELGVGPLADHYQAHLLAGQGNWGQARFLLEKTIPALREPEQIRQANLLLAECQGQLANWDAQLAAYDRALGSDRIGLQARLGQASLLARLGKIDAAIEAYRTVVRQAPQQGVALARLLIVQKLQLPPHERNWQEIDEVLARLPEAAAGATVVRAGVLAAQGQPEAARSFLQHELEKHPTQASLWVALEELAESQGDWEAAANLVDQAEARLPCQGQMALCRIRLAVKKDGTAVRPELAKVEACLDELPEADQSCVMQILGDAYFATGDRQSAERVWKHLAQQQPQNLPVRLPLLAVVLQDGDETALAGILNEIQLIEGNGGACASYAQAARLLLQARRGDRTLLQEAKTLAAAAARKRPTWSFVPVLQAQIYELEENWDDALAMYQRAVKLGERQPAVLRRVVDLLYRQRRYQEAHDLLVALPDLALTASDLGRKAAELTLLTSATVDRKQALKVARLAVPPDSRDYRDFLWLGQVAASAGQLHEAEELLHKAANLSQNNPDPWIALVMVLAKTNPQKAVAVLQQARDRLPAHVSPLVLAPGYEILGDLEHAEKSYQAILAAKPDDPDAMGSLAGFYSRSGQAPKAEACLRKLLHLPAGAPERIQPWARRQLAVVLAGTGRYVDFQEAAALIDKNCGSSVASLDNDRAKAIVLATQPNGRAEAIALFERVAGEQMLRPEEEFLLVNLYEQSGDKTRARQHMTSLLRSPEPRPRYLGHYIQTLLTDRDVDGAETWFRKLESLAPHALSTAILQAKLLQAKKQPVEAIAVLRKSARQQPDQRAAVAAALEEIGQFQAAEALFREEAADSQRPANMLLLAKFLGRHKRPAEALQLCERARSQCPPEKVGAAYLAILRHGGATEAQLQSVQSWLAAAAERQPESVLLVQFQAQLQDLRGHYAEAMALYRAALRRDPQNIVALNNLACLLALREGQSAEALDLVQKAIEVAGPQAELLDSRAVAYLASRQYQLAIEDLEEITHFRPTALVYFHLAQAQSQAKNRQAVRQAWGKAKELGLDYAAVHPLEQEVFARLEKELTDQ